MGSFVTNRKILAGEEILSNYKFVNCFFSRETCHQPWFLDLWIDLKTNHPEHKFVHKMRKTLTDMGYNADEAFNAEIV